MKKVAVKVTAIAALAAVQACGEAPFNPADQSPTEAQLAMSRGAQKISDCAIIDEPGRYVLEADVLVDDRAACVEDFGDGFFNLVGIRILASNVHLSLAGHAIRGDGSLGLDNGVGIRLANDVENVHITGGVIEGGGLFFDGMQTGGMNVSVHGMTVRGNGRFGIGSVFCGGCEYSGNTFTENGNAGIQTVFAGRDMPPTRISGNRFTENGIGITIGVFSGQVTIVGNEITDNAFVGIVDFLAPQGGNRIQGNTVSGNGDGGGISLFSNNNTLRGNTVLDNDGAGIEILKGGFFPGDSPTTGNVVQGNRAVGNAVDLSDANDECGNTWKSNTFESDSEGDGPKTGCIQ